MLQAWKEAAVPPTELPAVCFAPTSGDEGRAPTSPEPAGFTLAQVQILIRHGQRSTLFQPRAITNPHHFKCDVPDELRDMADRWTDTFRLVSHDGAPHAHQSFKADVEDDGSTCKPGQVTRAGLKQLLAVGDYLRRAYEATGALSGLSAHDIYVRTTAIKRTRTSAAALLTGLLRDDLSRFQQGSPVHIVLPYGGAQDSMLPNDCATGMRLVGAQEKAYIQSPGLAEASHKMFGPHPRDWDLQDAAGDVALNSVCDGGRLPCGAGGCLGNGLLKAVEVGTDAHFCQRYTGDAGGREASRLNMQPLLAEIVQRLREKAEGSPEAKRLVLLSGHDTTVAPAAAALGIYDCRWPPLASHMIFELWTPPRTQDPQSSFVRLLYNGKVVTGLVEGCNGSELCPLENIQAQVAALRGPGACNPSAASK